MRVGLRRIESKNHRVAMNCGKETTETPITTECTEKKFMNISVFSVVISASVVKFVTHDPNNAFHSTRLSGW